ncbi:MAG: zinc-ribbon domain-containing protein, partial [Candidatus Nanohaloarchaea archaeon]
MPYCTNCGHDVDDGDSHCPKCGEEVRQRSSNRFGKVSGVGGAPLPRDTKNAFIGILVGIVVFGGLQVGLSYWLGLFDVIDD